MRESTSRERPKGGNREQRVLRRIDPGFEKKLESELRAKMDKEIQYVKAEAGYVRIRVDRADILKICRLLKDSFGFVHISLITTIDMIEQFGLVYHLYSYQNKTIVEIKINIPKDDPKVESVTPLWAGANWHEREAYDMMGIVFANHPDLRRILLPQDYEYFPLRKDFKMILE